MKAALAGAALVVLAACEPPARLEAAPRQQPVAQPKSGITISGDAGVGVVYKG